MNRFLGAAAVGFLLVVPSGIATAECGDSHDPVHAQAADGRRGYQVMITFSPETPQERITQISQALGVTEQHRAFGRIVLGVAPASASVDSMKQAAQRYPEVLAVERGSTVRPQ